MDSSRENRAPATLIYSEDVTLKTDGDYSLSAVFQILFSGRSKAHLTSLRNPSNTSISAKYLRFTGLRFTGDATILQSVKSKDNLCSIFQKTDPALLSIDGENVTYSKTETSSPSSEEKSVTVDKASSAHVYQTTDFFPVIVMFVQSKTESKTGDKTETSSTTKKWVVDKNGGKVSARAFCTITSDKCSEVTIQHNPSLSSAEVVASSGYKTASSPTATDTITISKLQSTQFTNCLKDKFGIIA